MGCHFFWKCGSAAPTTQRFGEVLGREEEEEEREAIVQALGDHRMEYISIIHQIV